MGLMQSRISSTANTPLLAVDVGGTHARVGLVSTDPTDMRRLLAYRKYVCAEFPSLAAILGDFMASVPGEQVMRGVVASAGLALEGDTVIAANLAWPLSLNAIRDELGLVDLRLVNDFEAFAHATALVGTHEILRLSGPETALERGPILVLGPGTGLGGAVWIPTEAGATVLATEAGQAMLCAGTALEFEILESMLATRSHVPIEFALSGPGLVNLYNALSALRGISRKHASPSEVSAAALAGEDAIARQALEVFCGLLGSVVGDMALQYGISGGIYLAGGILPHIRDFLLQSTFVERYYNKGSMRKALERIPVRLVEHGQLGVLGAANWYLGPGSKKCD